jgi:hypothetical protein
VGGGKNETLLEDEQKILRVEIIGTNLYGSETKVVWSMTDRQTEYNPHNFYRNNNKCKTIFELLRRKKTKIDFLSLLYF